MRKKLGKILKGYNDVHFEDSFATGEGIKAVRLFFHFSFFILREMLF